MSIRRRTWVSQDANGLDKLLWVNVGSAYHVGSVHKVSVEPTLCDHTLMMKGLALTA